MTEVNFRSFLERRSYFQLLIVNNLEKEKVQALVKTDGFDLGKVDVQVTLNGTAVCHVELEEFLADMIDRSVEQACEKVGFYPFQELVQGKEDQLQALAESRALVILDSEVAERTKQVIEGKVFGPMRSLIDHLHTLESEAGYFAQKLWEDSERTTLLRSVKAKLRAGPVSEEDRLALLAEIDATGIW